MSQPAPHPTASVADGIDHHAKHSPDAIAIITPHTTLTYGALAQRVEQAAQQLCASGVAAGDRIALIVADELLLLTLLLAAARRAAPVLLIPRTTTPAQRNDWMTATGVKHCFSDVLPAGSQHGALHAMDAKALMATTSGAAQWHPPVHGLDPHTIFVIVAGSGSTGKPKLIPITHAQMQARTQRLCDRLNITAQDRLATMSHMEYVGSVHRLLAALRVGGSFVLLESDRKDWPLWHRRYGLTLLSATVFHAQKMLDEVRNHERPGTPVLDPIRLSLSSSVVTTELRQNIVKKLCSQLHVNYGTNEAWLVTVAEPRDLLQHPGTVGRPVIGVHVQILDTQGQPLPLGQTGLIAIQSDQVISGYLDDEAATQQAFRQGWFISGDMGYLTPDGHLIFCGRSDNMMIFNGINIFPIEIEQCLLSHPDVRDALAMPTRHAMHQDVPVAFVVLKENARVSQAQLQQFAAAALGPKQPRRVIPLPEIPRNAMGKPIKPALVKLLSQAMDNNISQLLAPPVQPINIGFSPQPLNATHRVLAWIRMVQGQDTPPASAKRVLASPQDEATQWLQTVLDLALALLQAARIPIFEPIKVTHCHPPSNTSPKWRAVCEHPAPALLPLPNLLKLIREAFKLAEWACQADIESPAQREEGFKRIETHALKDLSTHAPFGKSTFEVLRVAHRMGIPYRALPAGVFQLGWGRHARLIHRSTTDQDSAIGLHLTRDKFLTAQILRQASLPAPEHHKARTQGEAEQWATHIGYPVVVKPADLERGEGVTVDVTPSTLATAFETAHRLSPSKTVLIERQVQGVCHRLFIAQGQLLYAVKRLPMGVYGDGRSSINALVQAEYDAQMKRPPWMRSGVSSLHPLPLETLQRQGWAPSDVVPAGLFVALRRIESTAWGGVDEDVTQTAHPDNVQAAISATKLFGLDVAGVDLICEDITQAWHTHGGVINEVNYAPLLGGGEISRQHLPLYLSRLLKHQGRIPIETLVGEQATWAKGLKRWQHWVEAGFPVYLTDGRQTLNPQGHVHPMARQPLREQVQALLMDRTVGALVVVGIEHTREHKAHE